MVEQMAHLMVRRQQKRRGKDWGPKNPLKGYSE
jgi:hypothetical protein